jgi:hypothetical protein
MYPLLSLAIVVVRRVTCVSFVLDRQIRIRMGKGTWECKCKLCIQLFISRKREALPTSPEYYQYIAIAVSVRVRNEGCSVG